MSTRKYFLILLTAIGFVFSTNPINASENLETVTIQFKWFHQFQFAGYYAAVEKGFYAEEGLDVTLRERNPETDHIEDVLKDKAEYGVADAGLLLPRLQGKPVVLLAQIFQHSPLVFLALQRSGIRTPFDLKGKSVMIDNNYYKYPSLNAMILKTLDGIDKVTRIPETYRNDDLADGKTDVMVAYSTDQPFWFKERGIDVNVIDPRDYGIDFYGDNLFTTAKEIREHPQRVKKMIRASIKGWQYALEHKDEIVDLILKKYNTQKRSRDHLIYEAEETEKMIVPRFIDIGRFELSRFRKIAEIYNNLGLTNLTKMDDRFFYQGGTLQIKLDPDEQAWLEKHPKIKVGIMDAWPPMNYVDEQGIPKGIGVDLIKALNQRLGNVLRIEPGPFKDNLSNIKEKKLDVIMDVTPKPEREVFLNFTRPYLTIPHVIIGRRDGPYYNAEEDLIGKILALEKGFYNVRYFKKEHPGVRIKEYLNTSLALDAVARGKADAYAGNRAVATWIMGNEVLHNLQIQGRLSRAKSVLAIGVREDWPELVSILEKTLTAIHRKETGKILSKWVDLKVMNAQDLLELTSVQRAWLDAHPTITVAFDPVFPPVESVSRQGEYEGITRDFLDKIAKMLGVKFRAVTGASWAKAVEKVKSGEADMFSAVMRTPERQAYLSFTDSYLELSQMVFTRIDHPFVQNIRDLHGKRVCTIKGYAVTEFLRRDHPAIELVEANNTREALILLTTGQVDAYVDALLTTTYYIAEGGFTDVKVAGEAPYQLKLSMAVRKELTPLIPILNKALAGITEEEEQQILHRWHSIRYEVGFDYSLLWKVLLPMVLILVVVVYWNRRLSHEVTARQQSEAELRKLSRAIEASPASVIITDRGGTIEYVNTKFTEVTGYTAEEAIGRNPRIQSSGKQSPEFYREMWETMESGRVWRGEFCNRKKNGEIYWETAAIAPVKDAQGQITHYVAVKEDITERKRAAEQLASMAQFAEMNPAPVFRFDREGRLLLANRSARLLLGIPVDKQDLLLTTYPAWLQDAFLSAATRVQAVHHERCIEDRYYLFTFLTTIDTGEVNVYGADITDHKRFEDSLQAARKIAEAATRAKSEFLANMSHEIRTPMNAVLGFLELVLEDPALTELQRKHLTTAQISANGLLGLINDILDISKMESGKFTIEQRPFSLLRLMQEIHETMKLKAREKGLELKLDIQPSLSGSFVGDPLRIRQIIINLMGNAIKFTEKGGIFIRIMPAEEEDQLHFMIEDTGIGIPADRLSQIFEPFAQADTSTTRRFGGTGLGTTIARELVELMGGRIWAKSEEGKGSTFHFTINITPTDQVPEEADLFIIPGRAVLPGFRRGFRILLVEDVEANVDLAKIRLKQQNHEVKVAWNGREAIEAFERGGIDLILMDIQMPEMSGIEATTRIRALEAGTGGHVPIIAMTAGVTREETEKYLEKGMDAVVAKPIDFGKLFKTMETMVPEGVGQAISEDIMDVSAPSELELPPLDGVDIIKGMQLWQNPEVYARALLVFLRDYSNAAADLNRFIDEGDIDNAYRLAHTLRGVAGTLSMTEVADVAVNIDAALREKRIDDVKGQIPTLAAALETVVDSIRQLEAMQAVEEMPKKEMDVAHLKALFIKMLAAFDQFSPYAIEPFLSELKAYLAQDQLTPIEAHMERFDFDGAEQATVKLAKMLKIDLKG